LRRSRIVFHARNSFFANDASIKLALQCFRSGCDGRYVIPPQPDDGQHCEKGRKGADMNRATHALEDDITIEHEFENGEVIYLAYTAGQLIERYPPRRAGNAKVAKQLAAGVL